MATSTRRSFSAGRDGPSIDTSTKVSGVIYRRVERQTIRPDTIRAQTITSRPALGGPGGTVQRLGGGEPLQPRGRQSNGAVPVGGAVQYNQGIAQGAPAGLPTPTPTQQPIGWIAGEGDPNTAARVPRYRGDRYYDKTSRTLWVWQQTGDEEAEWVAVAKGTAERTIGIEAPVANNVYPIMAVADASYLLLSLSVINRTATGGSATAGTATVLVNGSAATMGTTVVEPGDFVGLRVDTVGTGILAASIVAGLA